MSKSELSNMKIINNKSSCFKNIFKQINLNKKNESKVCLNRLRCLRFSSNFLIAKRSTVGDNKTASKSEFNYADFFWTSSFNNNLEDNNHNFFMEYSPNYLFTYRNTKSLGYNNFFFINYFSSQIKFRMCSYNSIAALSVEKKFINSYSDNFMELFEIKGTGIPINSRLLKRKYLKSKILRKEIGDSNKKLFFRYNRMIEKNKIKNQDLVAISGGNFNLKSNLKYSLARFWNYFNKDSESKYLRNLGGLGFPISDLLKRTQQIIRFPVKITPYKQYEISNQFVRHPATTQIQLRRYLVSSISFQEFNCFRFREKKNISYTLFYGVTWRYFKMKIEGFFYKQLGIRMHIWFLNVWDIFLNGLNSQWHWFRYENSTIRFLTKKGQRFLIENREYAKFYVRTMALTLTLVGGSKLFMDNVSNMLGNYRNNWAFIIHVTKSLRYCINFFWFRFFINYKITLQGKIGGFLRAAKKVFKKGTITIEDRSSAITYYRGFPITRFGAYNLSFWLQYRIPTLVGKFEDLEYIDTMKILLGTYSVPWLAQRLASIVSTILQDRVYKINIKVAQYDRRVRTRQKLYLDIFNKNRIVINERNYFDESSLIKNIRKKRIKDIINKNFNNLSLLKSKTIYNLNKKIKNKIIKNDDEKIFKKIKKIQTENSSLLLSIKKKKLNYLKLVKKEKKFFKRKFFIKKFKDISKLSKK